MKLIKPAEISAKIMTLIDEAEKELIIVSPYNNLTGWNKLINRIKKAQSQGVDISWYTRKNNVEKNNSEEVRSIGIEPVLVDDLHAKIYMNEDYAIFTSMNMSKISDEKSIDIGYITENRTEYEELYKTFVRHIKSKPTPSKIKEQNVLGIIKPSAKDVKYLHIGSSDHYVKVIHEYIYHKYGAYEYRYKKGEVLEYFDFKVSGYKIQFIPYTRAMKIFICLPPLTPIKNFEQFTFQNKKAQELIKNNELECCDTESEQYIKYYYQLRYKNVYEWNNSDLEKLLKDLDILIEIVFSKV